MTRGFNHSPQPTLIYIGNLPKTKAQICRKDILTSPPHKGRTLLGHFNPQMAFQNSFFLSKFEPSHPTLLPHPSTSHPYATWYALFTLKIPFLVQAQTKASSGRLWLIGMLKIEEHPNLYK